MSKQEIRALIPKGVSLNAVAQAARQRGLSYDVAARCIGLRKNPGAYFTGRASGVWNATLWLNRTPQEQAGALKAVDTILPLIKKG